MCKYNKVFKYNARNTFFMNFYDIILFYIDITIYILYYIILYYTFILFYIAAFDILS